MTDRMTALAEGRKTYHGKQCTKCGGTERRTSRGSCLVCIREKEKRLQKKYRAEAKIEYGELVRQRDDLLEALEELIVWECLAPIEAHEKAVAAIARARGMK